MCSTCPANCEAQHVEAINVNKWLGRNKEGTAVTSSRRNEALVIIFQLLVKGYALKKLLLIEVLFFVRICLGKNFRMATALEERLRTTSKRLVLGYEYEIKVMDKIKLK